MKLCLVINPGSTSTKVGVFSGTKLILAKTLSHSQDELAPFPAIVSQKEYRAGLIRNFLAENSISPQDIKIIIAIAGLIAPGDAGVYEVNADMLHDLEEARYDEHAANLGAMIAATMAAELGVKAYVADAITVDEMEPVARLSGIPEIVRQGRSHTLNQKHTARMAARELGLRYEEAHLVVAHLGGGISVTAHRDGRMVDTNAARGEGPFCIDRSGGVNSFELAKLCFSGRFSQKEMLRKINGCGGVVAYLGTRDFREVEAHMNAGDKVATDVFEAMAYQIAKEIAAMTVALQGRTDAIVLTGGMANSARLCTRITGHVQYLAKVLVFPGEQELESLAEYAEAIQSGALTPKVYTRKDNKNV